MLSPLKYCVSLVAGVPLKPVADKADVVVIAVIAVPYLGGHLVDDQNGQIVLVRQISQIRGEGRQGFGALYVIRRIGRGDRTKMKGDAIDDDQLDGQW